MAFRPYRTSRRTLLVGACEDATTLPTCEIAAALIDGVISSAEVRSHVRRTGYRCTQE